MPGFLWQDQPSTVEPPAICMARSIRVAHRVIYSNCSIVLTSVPVRRPKSRRQGIIDLSDIDPSLDARSPINIPSWSVKTLSVKINIREPAARYTVDVLAFRTVL
jgi:hypothetical protein